jgi:hypothetical protein
VLRTALAQIGRAPTVRTSGFGSRHPIRLGSTDEDLALNRRTEIRLVLPEPLPIPASTLQSTFDDLCLSTGR